jgi:ferredoxin
MVAGLAAKFTAAGGTQPYLYSLLSGAGSVDPSTGIYSPGLHWYYTATIRVTDSKGATATASGSVSLANYQASGGTAFAVEVLNSCAGNIVFACQSSEDILDCSEAAAFTLGYTMAINYSGRDGSDPVSAGRVVSGTVDQSGQSFLDGDQLAEGDALLDVAYPESDLVIDLAPTNVEFGNRCP